MEQTRTVFFVQCGVAAANIALAVLVVSLVDPQGPAPGLALAYGGSYAVGAVTSYVVLRRVLGSLDGATLLRFCVRMVLAAGLAGAAAYAWRTGFVTLLGDDGNKAWSLLQLSTTALVDLGVLLLLARAMRIREINVVTSLVTSRLRR